MVKNKLLDTFLLSQGEIGIVKNSFFYKQTEKWSIKLIKHQQKTIKKNLVLFHLRPLNYFCLYD